MKNRSKLSRNFEAETYFMQELVLAKAGPPLLTTTLKYAKVRSRSTTQVSSLLSRSLATFILLQLLKRETTESGKANLATSTLTVEKTKSLVSVLKLTLGITL